MTKYHKIHQFKTKNMLKMTIKQSGRMDHYISTEIENIPMLKRSIKTIHGSIHVDNFQNIRVKRIS